MEKKEYSVTVGGKEITATFTDLADQANGAVIVKSGQSAVLATAVMSDYEREGIDYFPLTVDYEEKFYAAGLVLGGRFMRREGRPSDEAVLTGRVVDRTIRPLFNQGVRNEVQVVITVLSIDESTDPDVLSILAASLALGTSDIPWAGPVGAVRIGMQKSDSELVVNPFYKEREGAYLDLMVCGKDGNINMVEGGLLEASEDSVKKAFDTATKEIGALEEFQKKVISEMGKEKIEVNTREISETAKKLFDEKIGEKKVEEVLFSGVKKALYELKDEWTEIAKSELEEGEVGPAIQYIENVADDVLHRKALEENARPDGRDFKEVRNLYTQAGDFSEILHGVGIFYRGGTHVMSILTLGGPQDSQIVEGMEVRTKKYFMHHYNFPPFSGGETGRLGGMNRRAIGHGALAEKALQAVVPDRDTFPYTIRLVSESMASNGSTSMASVCAGSLALADGGVPIKRHVGGIAMGLIMGEGGKYKILTDIQGPEDHHGDMDFKVAGTEEGVTAIQMDVKVDGVPAKILGEALEDAREARIKIIEKIKEAIPEPRAELSEYAPRIEVIEIDPDKIGMVIGSGGKTIKKIMEDTSTAIDIDDNGIVHITGKADMSEKAKEIIADITHEYEEGEKTTGKVIKIFDFGAVVELKPGVEGLVHISELAPHRVEKVTDVVCQGEEVPIVIKKKDDRGKLSLSIVKADSDFAKKRGKKDCNSFS